MHIIIPMSGVGQRFIDAGYTVPKPLIVVDGKTMIQHVVDLTPGENKFTFICNHTHLTTTNMREQLLSIVPNGNIIEIADHNLGPVYTVMQALKYIDDDEEIIINHCDFGTYWNYDDFLKHTRDRDADGVVVGYKGFHPHMLGTTNYASMREKEQWMLEIKEKGSFTDNPMNEYTSNGTYYFKTGSIVKKYLKELLDKEMTVKDEYFVSLAYNLLLRDNLKVSIYEIQHMLQWGIPRDVEDYNSWSSYFKNILQQSSGNLQSLTNNMYVNGKPIFQNETQDASLEEMYNLSLKEKDEESSFQISETSNGIIFNQKKYQNLIESTDIDAIVWIYKHYRHSEDHPEKFNWIEVDNDIVKHISIKKQISKNPYKDYISVGTFYFKKIGAFRKIYEKLQKTSNTNIYISDIINEMIKMGYTIKTFEVDNFVTWNSSDELKTFKYWQSFFHKVDWHPYTLNADPTVKKDSVKAIDKKYRDFKQSYK